MGFTFQYFIRRRHFSWWTKYNCTFLFYKLSRDFHTELLDVLSAALDSGVAISVVLIFFWSVVLPMIWSMVPRLIGTDSSLQYPQNGTIGSNNIQAWWGESFPFLNANFMALPLQVIPFSTIRLTILVLHWKLWPVAKLHLGTFRVQLVSERNPNLLKSL